jgi:hypothetical protein
MNLFFEFLQVLQGTLLDVVPIAAILFGFQFAVIRKPIPNLGRVLVGFGYVLVGLSLFLLGLEKALFPVGKLMAEQLTNPSFIAGFSEDLQASVDAVKKAAQQLQWYDYAWVYVFAFMIGFSTTIAEPSLIAVAIKANEVSGGAIGVWGLRIAAALGVAIGISLGSYRIVVGHPIQYYIMAGYVVVVIQTFFAPKLIIPLAYDSGGVTTSTVTVPLVAALGLGLAETVPGRSTLIDGFGLIAFASLFPIISVMGYAQLSQWIAGRKSPKTSDALESNDAPLEVKSIEHTQQDAEKLATVTDR